LNESAKITNDEYRTPVVDRLVTFINIAVLRQTELQEAWDEANEGRL
jgi:hypothetical protein